MPEQSNKLIHADTYTFKYNSDEDSIDLNTLLLSQIHFLTVLNEVKNEVAPNTDLSIKIKPLTKGSVPFDIILNVSWLAGLFSPENVAYASGIIGTLVGLIQLKIWLKGKKPNKVEIREGKIVLTVGDTELIIDKSIYDISQRNEIIDKALQKGFQAIEKDESITGVEILDENKMPLLGVPRKEFENLTNSNDIFEEIIQKEPATQERLTIFKVVFDKGYKWQFYYQGRKISASISDDAFMERLNKGERFAKGDVLVVEIEKEKVFDNSVDIFVEKDFKILKVLEHIPRPEESKTVNLFE